MRITTVDAFTDRPFAGNPAAVCLLATPRDEQWMRNVAREMNLAETAFLVPRDDGFDLRWFTPTVEVDLCGHATLGSAHALWEQGVLPPGTTARFHTRSGLLTAVQREGWIELDFPAKRATEVAPPPGLLEALGAPARWAGKSQFDYLIELESEAAVRSLKPDLGSIAQLPVRGVIVTARAEQGSDVDFVSRFFAPAVGVPEDPVTGSAHCCLSPYWTGKLGRDSLTGYQASPRGGIVRVRLAGDRVMLGGQAVTVLNAELVE
ncbi:MAG: PhzF family phenazine biosynthesis protein [Gemmatimonadota bacterium]